MAPNLAVLLRLLLIADDALLGGRDLPAVARAAERGGVTAVQLRLKRATARELAAATRVLLGGLRIPVLVNDRLDVALAVGAAGAHLGPEDVPLALARRIAPAGFILGASVGSEAEAASAAVADYWGVGPWRATRTKDDAGAPLGPEGFRRVAALARGTPCVAIGGITPEDVSEALAAGAVGVAVAGGILVGTDVEDRARSYAAGFRPS